VAEADTDWLAHTVPHSFLARYGERAEAERLVTEKGLQGQTQARHLATLAAVTTLRTVWAQPFVVTTATPTPLSPVRVELGVTVDSGAATICTPHDPEAR